MQESICSWQRDLYPLRGLLSRGKPRKVDIRDIPPEERQLTFRYLPEKLEELMKYYEMTQEEIARLCEVGKTAVSKWATGAGNPSITALRLLSVSLDPQTPLWWLTGGPETGSLKEALQKEQDKQNVTDGEESIDEEIEFIPVIEDRIAAGPAKILTVMRSGIGKLEEGERMPVPKGFLIEGNEYRVIRLTGDSMEPTLRPGALLLVNFTRCKPERLLKRIVAAWTADKGARIKRLYDDGNHWRLHSENPEYGEEKIPKHGRLFQVAAVEFVWQRIE